MKRQATVCGLDFLKSRVLNDKVDIYRTIGNGCRGRSGIVRDESASFERLGRWRGLPM
jgi:hypothetical protein